MFCTDCIRNWNAESALVSLTEKGLSSVSLMWVVQWCDLEWQERGTAALGTWEPGKCCQVSAASPGEEEPVWISVLWAGGASGTGTAHTWSCSVLWESFSIPWKGFGFSCNSGRAGGCSSPSSFLYKYWSARGRFRTPQMGQRLSHHIFCSKCSLETLSKSCFTSPVLHSLFFSEIHKSVQAEQPKAELQPRASKHRRFLPLPQQPLQSFCTTHCSKNTFTLLQTER